MKTFISTATLVGLISSAVPALAQYDPTARHCRFFAETSTYGYQKPERTVVKKTGSLLIDWSPITGKVHRYNWFLVPGELYSEYTGPGPARIRGKTSTRSSLLLDIRVKTHYTGLNNNFVHARLFNGHGDSAYWNFAGILEQTGSGWIGASGKITCRH